MIGMNKNKKKSWGVVKIFPIQKGAVVKKRLKTSDLGCESIKL